MRKIADRSGHDLARLGLEHKPVPRWLSFTHRIVVIAVLCLTVFAVLMLIATIFLGGHSLATRLLFLWQRVDSIWT